MTPVKVTHVSAGVAPVTRLDAQGELEELIRVQRQYEGDPLHRLEWERWQDGMETAPSAVSGIDKY